MTYADKVYAELALMHAEESKDETLSLLGLLLPAPYAPWECRICGLWNSFWRELCPGCGFTKERCTRRRA